MRKIAVLGAVVLLVGAAAWLAHPHFVAQAGEKAEKAEEHGYIGAASCKACHSKPAKGEQYVKWQNGPHADAYETLLSEQSQAIAKEMGLEQPAHEAEACLKCHVTAHGVDPELLGKKYDKADGVGCETCHGPAKDWKITHMRDVEKAMTQGMIEPTEELCLTCHNEESPTYKPWDKEKKFAAVAHPNPQNEEE
ncbi:MAG: cytochrome C554 [Candidatus Eisenbacteria bacterium]|nr:cytochrome C554 [Candidatus Eisenbacteria bacterium]